MQIQGLPLDYLKNAENLRSSSDLVTERTAGQNSSLISSASESTQNLSPLVQLSYTHNLTELTFSQNETIVGYRSKDNSLALRAESQTDIHLRQEKVSLELTFSAESLGLTSKDFEALKGEAMEMSLSFKYNQTRVDYQSTTQMVKTMRTPDELLNDLSKALMDVMSKKGDKNIMLNMDDEAVKTLLGDEKVSKVFREIMMLISFLNSMRIHGGERKNQNINLTGKGQPYQSTQEKLSIDSQEMMVDLKIRILPPAANAEQSDLATEQVESVPEQSLEEDTSTQPEVEKKVEKKVNYTA